MADVQRPLGLVATATTTQLAGARQVHDSAHWFTTSVNDCLNKVLNTVSLPYDCRKFTKNDPETDAEIIVINVQNSSLYTC